MRNPAGPDPDSRRESGARAQAPLTYAAAFGASITSLYRTAIAQS
jgi:hypothetical protein